MSLPNALSDYYMNQVATALVVTVLLIGGAFTLGWYCGDRWNVPSVTVEARP